MRKNGRRESKGSNKRRKGKVSYSGNTMERGGKVAGLRYRLTVRKCREKAADRDKDRLYVCAYGRGCMGRHFRNINLKQPRL